MGGPLNNCGDARAWIYLLGEPRSRVSMAPEGRNESFMVFAEMEGCLSWFDSRVKSCALGMNGEAGVGVGLGTCVEWEAVGS